MHIYLIRIFKVSIPSFPLNLMFLCRYDSVTMSGQLLWQDKLNEMNKPFFDLCDGIFVNYTWKVGYLAVFLLKSTSHLLPIFSYIFLLWIFRMITQKFHLNLLGTASLMCTWALTSLEEIHMAEDNGMYVLKSISFCGIKGFKLICMDRLISLSDMPFFFWKFKTNVALDLLRMVDVSAAIFAPGWIYETNQGPDFQTAQNR